MTMTLEQVRDWLIKEGQFRIRVQGKNEHDNNLLKMADAINSHLAQPAQSVDVRAIPDARPLPELMMASYHEAVGWNAYREALITRAIGNAQSVNVRNVVLKSLRHATTKVVELEVTEDGERIGIITFPASAVGRRYKMVRIDADLQEQAE